MGISSTSVPGLTTYLSRFSFSRLDILFSCSISFQLVGKPNFSRKYYLKASCILVFDNILHLAAQSQLITFSARIDLFFCASCANFSISYALQNFCAINGIKSLSFYGLSSILVHSSTFIISAIWCRMSSTLCIVKLSLKPYVRKIFSALSTSRYVITSSSKSRTPVRSAKTL